VVPVHAPEYPDDWNVFAGKWMERERVSGNLAVLMAGPSGRHPQANPRMEIIDVRRDGGGKHVNQYPH